MAESNSHVPETASNQFESCDEDLYELKWDDFQCTLATSCSYLRDHEDLVDVSLVSGGRRWSAHKLILCAASPWFKSLLKDNPCKHPIIILNEDYEEHLSNILDFIYSGCVRVPQSTLKKFQNLAEYLQIMGLAESHEIDSEAYNSSTGRRKHKLPPEDTTLREESAREKKPCPNIPEQNSPSPSTPFTYLEPKLEIHDSPVEYSEFNSGAVPSTNYDKSYTTSHQDFYQNITNYNQEQPYESKYEGNSSHNSLQDLMSITGRLKDIEPSRHVQSYSNSNVESGLILCNSNSSGYSHRSSYSSHSYNNARHIRDTRYTEERSLVPYVPPHQDSSTYACPSKAPAHNLRWEQPRFCPSCQKTYSNNSNFRRHFKYMPECLSALEALGYPVN